MLTTRDITETAQVPVEAVPDPVDQFAIADERMAAAKALSLLPLAIRKRAVDAAALRLDGYREAEIAVLTGYSLRTLFADRQALKGALKSQGLEF